MSILGLVDTMSTLVSVGPDAAGKARRRVRRTWSDEEKRQLVAQTYEAGTSVSIVARRHDLNANLLFTWRREARRDERTHPVRTAVAWVPLAKRLSFRARGYPRLRV